MDISRLSEGSRILDAWPQQLPNELVEFKFENNFIQLGYDPLPDREEYLKRLGKYLTHGINYYIIKVLDNHQIILHYLIINLLFDTTYIQ